MLCALGADSKRKTVTISLDFVLQSVKYGISLISLRPLIMIIKVSRSGLSGFLKGVQWSNVGPFVVRYGAFGVPEISLYMKRKSYQDNSYTRATEGTTVQFDAVFDKRNDRSASAEALAGLDAIKLVIEMRLTTVTIERDSRIVIQKCQSTEIDKSVLEQKKRWREGRTHTWEGRRQFTELQTQREDGENRQIEDEWTRSRAQLRVARN
ncbi:hypothetical protein PVK06_035113 [Gossypium arboreum]|uniref:RNase H type-1 domain-containing protein n=1 Tax=Gossypium arboreum TaxID=29729 RepID=A0ABR0NGJ2_GOSAR|nr:hypothetical protein PVK06_035113 [Gossypium arboreum]